MTIREIVERFNFLEDEPEDLIKELEAQAKDIRKDGGNGENDIR